MTEEKAKKVFEQYNRTSDVVRCPYGRATIRKLLDSYARAAVNLYGIISRDDFVNIFNKQNVDQTSNEEIYILLLPLVLKDGWYGFYKGYIVHYLFFDNFDHADYLLKHQADKPRYIPEKDEFLKYVIEDYADNALIKLSFDTPLPDGEYIILLTSPEPEKGVGIWTKPANFDGQRVYADGMLLDDTSVQMQLTYANTPNNLYGTLSMD